MIVLAISALAIAEGFPLQWVPTLLFCATLVDIVAWANMGGMIKTIAQARRVKQ